MPSPLVKKLAKDLGKSEASIEKVWDKAKSIVKKEYDYSEENDSFWALTTALTKKMLKVEGRVSFAEYCEFSRLDTNDLILSEATLIKNKGNIVMINTDAFKSAVKKAFKSLIGVKTIDNGQGISFMFGKAVNPKDIQDFIVNLLADGGVKRNLLNVSIEATPRGNMIVDLSANGKLDFILR